MISYPSRYEGYGNAFVETVYTKKPLLVNEYIVFSLDIKPKGFKVIFFNQYITDETMKGIRELLDNPSRTANMVENNYLLGWRYLSFEMLEEKLEQLLIDIYGS